MCDIYLMEKERRKRERKETRIFKISIQRYSKRILKHKDPSEVKDMEC